MTCGEPLEPIDRDPLECSIDFTNRTQWSDFYITSDVGTRAEGLLKVRSLSERWRRICEEKGKEVKTSKPGG